MTITFFRQHIFKTFLINAILDRPDAYVLMLVIFEECEFRNKVFA